jgi:hypothetical protein
MSYASLIRWSGVALIVGAVLGLAYLFHPLEPSLSTMQYPSWLYAHALTGLGFLLIVPGLVGLYLFLGDGSGILGLLAYFLASIGSAITAGLLLLIEATLLPVAASNPALATLADPTSPAYNGSLALPLLMGGSLVFLVGYVLLGIAMLRARTFPRFAAYLIIVGGVLFALPVPPAPVIVNIVGTVLLSGGLISVGYTLLSDARQMKAGSELAVGAQS